MREEEDFSVAVTNDQIKEKDYSFSAGQYFEIKIPHIDIAEEEFNSRIENYKKDLSELFDKDDELRAKIKENFEKLKYEWYF